MNKITLAQREALDVVKDMIDKSNTDIPDYGTKILTLILGILNIDCRVEHTNTDITDIEGDKTLPINPNKGNDNLQLNIPDWIKSVPTPPFIPGDRTQDPAPWDPRVWYNNELEPEPIRTNAHEDVRYATSISCTDNKNGIVHTTNNVDSVQYTGDFTDTQTSLKDK